MKKLICILLCAAMVFSLGISAFAADSGYDTVEGEYTYCPSLGFLDIVGNQTGSFTYSDEYFTRSGYEYNHDLAIMTMIMNQTCFASADSAKDGWETANSNFNYLLKQCGFSDLAANADAVRHPEGDTIGAYAANKHLTVDGKDYTLIALGVRGHNYGGEWYSNFDLGYSGDHAGFADARDKVLSFLKDYVKEYNIKGNVKIWLTGYSRGAIAANMVGGELDKGFNMGKGVKLDTRDLYCYTFETPQGTADVNCRDAVFCNIHNILNYNDLVPLVSFTAWGHSRYGVDYYLPCRQYDACYAQLKPEVDAKLDQMGWMNILGLTLNTIDDFHYITLNPLTASEKSKITQIEYYDEVLNALFDTMAPSREDYVNNVQADLMELSRTLLGVDPDRLMNAIALFGQKFVSMDNLNELIASIGKGSSAVNVTVDLFMEAMQEANCAGYNGDQVRAMLKNMMPLLLNFVKEYPDTALTLMGNLVQIINAHFPEIDLTWLRVTPASFFEKQNHNYVNGVFAYNGDKLPDIFSDVKAGDWCYDAIRWAYNEGITTGYTETEFLPDGACTRGQVVTFLWRAAGSPEPKLKICPFKDVSADSPYYKAIIWAAENGIALGYDVTHFRPNESCTRAQIVTFIWRYEGHPTTMAKCPFEDVSVISPYYKAILWASENGITTGYDATHFCPDNTCTRAQVVTFLYRDMA